MCCRRWMIRVDVTLESSGMGGRQTKYTSYYYIPGVHEKDDQRVSYAEAQVCHEQCRTARHETNNIL